jgi:hypothetical protein
VKFNCDERVNIRGDFASCGGLLHKFNGRWIKKRFSCKFEIFDVLHAEMWIFIWHLNLIWLAGRVYLT